MNRQSMSLKGWRNTHFGNVVGKRGLFRDGDWVESKDQDPEGDVRLVQLADIGEGVYMNKSARFLTTSKAKELRCTFLNPSDLLVARMPEPIGRACVFPGDPKRCVTVVDVCIVRPDPDLVDVQWLKWAANSPGFRFSLGRFTTGTTRKRISRKNLEQIPLTIPPLPEQHRIAAILNKTNAIRRKRHEVLLYLANLKTSIFCKMFGNVVRNSKGWPTSRLGDVCDSRLGKMLDAKQQTGKYRRPYLRNANVQWNRLDLSEVFEMDFNEKDRKIFRLRYGDVLICEGGEVGRAALWHDQLAECYFQKALHRVRPDSAMVTSEYILNLMWFYAHNGGFKNHVTSATIAHLTGVKLKEIVIPIPPLSLQKEFVARVRKTMKLESEQVKTSRRLDELFNSLVQYAFSGLLMGNVSKMGRW
jgi:type I restriction enzyme S subunit